MRTLKIKYPTHIQKRQLGDKLFVLETIRDLDEAIDLICQAMTPQEQLDPFAEDLCPYFGVLWPAAEGLARYLFENPELVKNKKVLELGSGLAYPSLVVAHLGAEVLATDYHPDVEEYVQRNARHSTVELKYERLNWREPSVHEQYDVVMGSDVLYESKHASEVAKGLIRFMKPGGLIILSDPGRAYLQKFVHAMNGEGFREQMESVKVGSDEIFVIIFKN
jgi:predicted nicotinamide N-methyase